MSTHRLCDSPVVLGGTPPRLFRLTPAGVDRFELVASGADVTPGPLTARLVAAGAIHPVAAPAPQRFAEATVVIPARDPDVHRLRRLVAALTTAMPVVIVDDGSRCPIRFDQTDHVGPYGFEVLRRPTPGGPASARNAGLRHVATASAAGDLVIFVDSDVELSDAATLATMLGHFDDPVVVAVAPRVRSSPTPGRLGRYEAEHSPLDLGSRPAIVRPGAPVAYVPATVLAVRRAALDGIAGFDEALRFGEDVDAVWRLVAGGGTCRYEPAVAVEHRPRPTWAAWARQRFDYGTSAAPLARRHRAGLPAIRVTGATPVTVALAALGAPRTAATIAAGSATALAATLRSRSLRPLDAAIIATRLSWGAHVQTALQLAEVVRRTWWPLAAGAAIVSSRARRVGALALLGAVARSASPRLVPIRIADDIAYGCGVWAGVVRHRDPGPLAIRLGRHA